MVSPSSRIFARSNCLRPRNPPVYKHACRVLGTAQHCECCSKDVHQKESDGTRSILGFRSIRPRCVDVEAAAYVSGEKQHISHCTFRSFNFLKKKKVARHDGACLMPAILSHRRQREKKEFEANTKYSHTTTSLFA